MEEQPKEDFLEVDPKIPGQNYVCLSFVSPEKVMKQKEVFFTSKFMDYIFNDENDLYSKDIRAKFLNKEVKPTYEAIKTMYEDWKYTRTTDLEAEFHEINDFKTTMRGMKVRGVYDSHKEANVRAQILRRKDPSFNVFVGQVGYWLPWDPECESVPTQEYQEGMLNDLVKQYKENLTSKDELYEQVKNEKIEKAKKEINERKEALRAQNEMKVTPDDNKEDVENIEKLREIINESDKLFYENLKKEQAEKNGVTSNMDVETPDNKKTDSKLTFDEFGDYVTSNLGEGDSITIEQVITALDTATLDTATLDTAMLDTATLDTATLDTATLDTADSKLEESFKVESMENLESEDPWIQRKNKKD
jgi:uncharacterized protein YjbI with pentapeptide repeats